DGIRDFHVTGVQTCALPILRRLTADLRDAVGRDAVVMTDQEGGRVQRLRAPHWTDWPAPLDSASDGAEAVRLRHRLMGRELRAEIGRASCRASVKIAEVRAS